MWGAVRTGILSADRAGIPCGFLPIGHMIVKGPVYRLGRAYIGKEGVRGKEAESPERIE